MCPDCGHYAPPAERILIIKLAALGDVLRTTAVLPGLKTAHPRSSITWLTLSSATPLLDANPWIDEVWSLEIDTPARLAAQQFDLVFCPDADKRAAGLAAQARGAAKRGLWLDPRGVVQPASPEAEHWLEMGAFDSLKKHNQKSYQQILYEMLGLPYQHQEIVYQVRATERVQAQRWLADQGWRTNQRIVAFNLGGGGRWKKKLWKPWHFRALAQALAADSNTALLLVGGQQERALLEELQRGLPGIILSSGPDRALRETAALLSLCAVLVTGDTLGLHLASALRVPTIVLLGPTSASELELYQRGEKLVAPVPCVCCYLSDCTVDPDCMQSIAPDRVFEAVNRWLPA